MSRLPRAAASRNMSACSAQAISHVGCRLMVASSANTNRPFAPAVLGDIARAFATKAAMSSDADGLVSGNEPDLPDPAFCAEVTSPAGFGLIGSLDIIARELQQALCGPGSGDGQCSAGAPILLAAGKDRDCAKRYVSSCLYRIAQPCLHLS